MEYGLIGINTSKSLSSSIHKDLAGIEYGRMSFSSENEVKEFLKTDFKGINVTVPYKSLVFSLCDAISPNSLETGVVNTIIKKDGKLYGYNTDIDGFEYLLKVNHIEVKNKNCLVLGTGASSKTVSFVLKSLGCKTIKFLSRNPDGINSYIYSTNDILSEAQIIINTTPIKDKVLFDLNVCINLETFIDINYQPYRTANLLEAFKKGIRTVNGLQMLVMQALKADELFLKKKIDEDVIDKEIRSLHKTTMNIVLIGHPYSGKTTIGHELANRLNKKFIDLDEEISKECGLTIKDFFEKYGETKFRDLEAKVLKEICSINSNVVLSTGGGTILKEENIDLLLSFGKVINLQRILDNCEPDKSRPLSKNKHELSDIVKNREHIYSKYCDLTVSNNGTISDCIDKIEECL